MPLKYSTATLNVSSLVNSAAASLGLNTALVPPVDRSTTSLGLDVIILMSAVDSTATSLRLDAALVLALDGASSSLRFDIRALHGNIVVIIWI